MNTTSNSNKVVWGSLDPARRIIDIYPKAIAKKIESSLIKWQTSDDGGRNSGLNGHCVLGTDFFNATIHFNVVGNFYQTTPGASLGRYGFKQPGYRSVFRKILSEDTEYFEIMTKNISQEPRIVYDSDLCERTITVSKDKFQNCIIDSDAIDINQEILYRSWKPEDLISDSYDTPVVVWQWCRGIPEKQGNIHLLNDSWWTPYLNDQNIIIENAFKNEESQVNINLSVDNGERTIIIDRFSCFAKQVRYENQLATGIRIIKRTILTIQELRQKIDKMNYLPVDIDVLSEVIDTDTIPSEFYCCISQDIMKDPVKTVDNHTYDRQSIERWFIDHNTSPLTGLSLISKTLVSNTELRKQIEEFTRIKIEEINKNQNTNIVTSITSQNNHSLTYEEPSDSDNDSEVDE